MITNDDVEKIREAVKVASRIQSGPEALDPLLADILEEFEALGYSAITALSRHNSAGYTASRMASCQIEGQ
jgi:hypothetical protein